MENHVYKQPIEQALWPQDLIQHSMDPVDDVHAEITLYEAGGELRIKCRIFGTAAYPGFAHGVKVWTAMGAYNANMRLASYSQRRMQVARKRLTATLPTIIGIMLQAKPDWDAVRDLLSEPAMAAA